MSTSRHASLSCDYALCKTEPINRHTRTRCRRAAKAAGWYVVKGDSATVKTGMDVDYCTLECHDRALARVAEQAERNRQAKLNRDAFANMISYAPVSEAQLHEAEAVRNGWAELDPLQIKRGGMKFPTPEAAVDDGGNPDLEPLPDPLAVTATEAEQQAEIDRDLLEEQAEWYQAASAEHEPDPEAFLPGGPCSCLGGED